MVQHISNGQKKKKMYCGKDTNGTIPGQDVKNLREQGINTVQQEKSKESLRKSYCGQY